MQPGYPGPGQDPYGQQQPQNNDPYAQPQYPQQPPQYADPYAQPQQPYQDPYGQQPTSGNPYGQQPTSGSPYGQQPTSGSPYPSSPGAYPSYQVAGYGAPAPPVTGQNNTLGILALIFGILAIPAGFCCSLAALLPGGAGVVLGILGMKKVAQGQANNRGMALAGAICGGVGAVIGIAAFILSLVLNFNGFPYS